MCVRMDVRARSPIFFRLRNMSLTRCQAPSRQKPNTLLVLFFIVVVPLAARLFLCFIYQIESHEGTDFRTQRLFPLSRKYYCLPALCV